MIPAEAGTAQWEQEGETDRLRSPSCGSLVVGVELEPNLHHQGFRGPELSPAGAERDRCIPCTGCRRPTWNYSAVCWPCIDERGNR